MIRFLKRSGTAGTILILFAVVLTEGLYGQAPRTISHQGLLTDDLGNPVVDSTFSLTFAIYDDASGGTMLWDQTMDIATSGGYFNAELGPISGVDFGQPLWLGTSVNPESEMAPRTPLTSVPSTFAVVHPYKAVTDTSAAGIWMENSGSGDAVLAYNRGSGTAGAFIVADPSGTNTNSGVFGQNDALGPAIFGQHIGVGGEAGRFENTDPGNGAPVLSIANSGTGPGLYSSDNAVIETFDLSPTGAEGINEDISIYAADAQVGLYSNAGGIIGSGFQFGEIVTGSLINKWSMFRNTTGASGALHFTWGANPSYSQNPTVVRFDTSGVVTASGFEFSVPDTSWVSVSGNAMTPLYIDSATVWYGAAFLDHTTNYDWVHGSIQIPHGAKIEEFVCTVYDNSSDNNLRCLLCTRSDRVSCNNIIALVQTSGTPGVTDVSDTSFSMDIVDNQTYSYDVRIFPVNGEWRDSGFDLEIIKASVKYTMERAN